MTLNAKCPVVVFYKQVLTAPLVPSSISVAENYFDPQDQFASKKRKNEIHSRCAADGCCGDYEQPLWRTV